MNAHLGYATLGILMIGARAQAQSACGDIQDFLGDRATDVVCFESPDLTTNNTDAVHPTTPEDNSIAGLPGGAFTPRTDRDTISPAPPDRTPIFRAVPGIQVQGRFADDPTGEARFLRRFPTDWHGRLVVAGASGTRSEFNGDFAWSDYVVQRGYAYASQNKGVLNLFIVSLNSPTPPADPLACRLNPTSPVWVHFYDNDPGQPFTRWADYIVKAAQIAREGVQANYGRPPRFTYPVSPSNAAYPVPR